MKLNDLIQQVKNGLQQSSQQDGTIKSISTQTSILSSITKEIRRISSIIGSSNAQLSQSTQARSVSKSTFSRARGALANVARKVFASRAPKMQPGSNVVKASPVTRMAAQEAQPQEQQAQQPQQQESAIDPATALRNIALVAAPLALIQTDFKNLVQSILSKIITDDITDDIEKKARSLTNDVEDLKREFEAKTGKGSGSGTQSPGTSPTPSGNNAAFTDFQRGIPRVASPEPSAPTPSANQQGPASQAAPQTPQPSQPSPEDSSAGPSSNPYVLGADRDPFVEPSPPEASPASQTEKQDRIPGPNDPPPKQVNYTPVKPVGKPSFTSDTSNVPAGAEALQDIIGRAESGKSYYIYNYYDDKGSLKVGYMPKEFWTIKEIMKKQSIPKGKDSVWAIGYYQYTPIAFRPVFEKVREYSKNSESPITENSRFDRRVQEKFYAVSLFKGRPPLREFINQKDEPTERQLRDAALSASQEWAGLPTPYQVNYWQNPQAPNKDKKPTGNSNRERIVGWAEGKPIPLDVNSQQSYYPPTLRDEKTGNIVRQGDQANVPLKDLISALKRERESWQGLSPEQQQKIFRDLGMRLTGKEEPQPENRPARRPPAKKAETELEGEGAPKVAEAIPTPSQYDGKELDERSGQVAFNQQPPVQPTVVNFVDNSTNIIKNKKGAPPPSGAPSVYYSSLT